MSKPIQYVPGQSRTHDELAQIYEGISGSPIVEAEPATERDPKDPFGITERKVGDDFDLGNKCAERLTKFFQLVVSEFNLTPEVAIYAAELTSLNILNAKDIPLSSAKIQEARAKAFAYYTDAVRRLP